ncbi:MAG TPA: NUDIX hydrolase [Burkholderiales bacterium]|nr:NUDIX hydrolase [Burkholderiales bacterium]
MSSDFTEKKISSRAAYRGRLLSVNEDEVSLPDGGTALREYVLHPGAALILPVFDDGAVLLERQYRYPVGQHFYELPAGKFEAGEASLVTAQRELLEETGYVAFEWRELGTVHPCIGYSDERIDFFLARKLEFKGAKPDDGEFLETLRVPLAEGIDWIRRGRITDTKTILGLFWAERILKEGW